MKYKLQSTFYLPILLFAALWCTSFKAVDYTGQNILLLLGVNSSTKEFKELRKNWALDNNNENTQTGIRLLVNSINGTVEAILVAGENYYSGSNRFKKYTAELPYKILLSDDIPALEKKLGNGQKLVGRNTLKFYRGNTALEVSFTNLETGKISSIKFYKEEKPVADIIPYHIQAPSELRKVPTTNQVFEQKRTQFEQAMPAPPVAKSKKEEQEGNNLIPNLNAPAALKKEPVNKQVLGPKSSQLEKPLDVPPVVVNKKGELYDARFSPFKRALLDVFKSYRESNFFSIKNEQRNSGNFWNYKFTYSTKIKIPGEKFNMLYSFPFVYSPLDFVSIIKESEGYDASFVAVYKDYEKKLMKEFPLSEGWKSSCIQNPESKSLPDLEFTNDKYGSIVLDYSRSPKGKYILYIRFLLNSD